MSRFLPPIVVLGLALACSRQENTPLEHPTDLVGRWVRLKADSSWGDTLEYLSDGRVLGSEGNPVPATARWGTKPGPLGTHLFCAADGSEGACQSYRFADSVMVVGGGPSGPSYFRRVFVPR